MWDLFIYLQIYALIYAVALSAWKIAQQIPYLFNKANLVPQKWFSNVVCLSIYLSVCLSVSLYNSIIAERILNVKSIKFNKHFWIALKFEAENKHDIG